jgi:hypothetical protein
MAIVANKYEAKSKIKLPSLNEKGNGNFAKNDEEASVVDSLLGSSQISAGKNSIGGFQSTGTHQRNLSRSAEAPIPGTGSEASSKTGTKKKQPQALSARVELFQSSCKKFNSFKDLDTAMARDQRQPLSQATITDREHVGAGTLSGYLQK